MGADKALLELHGKPLIMLALESFQGFPEILVSAAETESYAFTGARVVPDERPGMGPLGGIISVLKAAEAELVCFRPVDAPLVPAGLHLALAGECASTVCDAATAGAPPSTGYDATVPTFKGKPEPLLACFSKTALPALESLAAQGNYKAADAFPLLNTSYISLDEPGLLARFGDPSSYLINANDRESFETLIR